MADSQTPAFLVLADLADSIAGKLHHEALLQCHAVAPPPAAVRAPRDAVALGPEGLQGWMRQAVVVAAAVGNQPASQRREWG